MRLATGYFPDPSLVQTGTMAGFVNSSKNLGGSEPKADGGSTKHDEALANEIA